jgi:hypothetical protein
MKVLTASRKRGKHWEDCKKVIETLRRIKTELSFKREVEFEGYILGSLGGQNFSETVYDQRSRKKVKTRVTLFAKDHRADMSIGEEGTAIEVKLVKNGDSVRTAIGQALFYRTQYRFVVLFLIDVMPEHDIFRAIEESASTECLLCKEIEELNIFIICKKALPH